MRQLTNGYIILKIQVGDVIYIEANNGAVKRVGRSDTYSTEYDLEADEFVPIPKGDVHKELFLGRNQIDYSCFITYDKYVQVIGLRNRLQEKGYRSRRYTL